MDPTTVLSVVMASKAALKAVCVFNAACRLHSWARWLGLGRTKRETVGAC